mmetsp:Transcript_27731/g.45618  ORF Transcript_27731/g.45618 Transcript_27731/m.45618 type:complete len:259 (+) Transcript_27731:106-882(+)
MLFKFHNKSKTSLSQFVGSNDSPPAAPPRRGASSPLSFFFYFQSFLMDMFMSESFFMTLATAISKSSWVTWIRRSRRANMPASVHTALHSAPEALGIFSAMLLRSMPRSKFIFRLWMPRMSCRDPRVGLGNSIFRSMRPGRSSAGSRMSMRLVHMITLMFWAGSKPSSWFSSSMSVRWISRSALVPSENRDPPIASTSSMKMTQGWWSLAYPNISRTTRALSPMYLSTMAEATTLRKVAWMPLASARASSVLPVPGGP